MKLQQILSIGRLRRRLHSLRNAHEDRDLIAAEFDATFYRDAYPDVAASGADPADHFLRHGWKEGRDPSAAFSVADYLDAYPDVAASGLNPFVHFLRAGRAEGRAPRSALGFRYQVISRLTPMAERMARAATANARIQPRSRAELAAALRTSRSGLRDLHVTFSHDDYTANVGGVQLCLRREGAQFAALGRDHLHLFPVEPWPMLRTAGEASPLGVVWNGVFVGPFTPETVTLTLAGAAGAPGRRSFAIHSLLGHAVDEVSAILSAAGLKAGFFWLHDFASLCAGYHLLRNDVADCGAPPPSSPACGVCLYGPYRQRHLQEHARLFAALDLTVVAPSASALATWKAGWSYPAKAHVVAPHARLVERDPLDEPTAGKPLTVVFLGWAAPLKGWSIFRDLALKYSADPRYAFCHLASQTPGGSPVEFHQVLVSEDAPLAMRDAVSGLGIDVALIWPLCRETFSFTAYEATAGGAAVLTWPDSGNVAAFVEETGHGRVIADEAALDALFETGEILELARSKLRPKLYDLDYSAMTAALIDQDRP